MFVTIMRTARISDLKRGHLTAGFVPWLVVRSFHSCDSVDCTIVTIERRSPDRLFVGPLYICVLHALGFVPSRVFLRYRVDNRIQAYSIKNRPVLGLGWSFGEPQPQLAQRVEGIVLDPSGAPIPDVTVMDRTENGVAALRTTKTNSKGNFHFPSQHVGRLPITGQLTDNIHRTPASATSSVEVNT